MFAMFNVSYADTYYFKGCKLSDDLTGNYVIDFKNNIIEANVKRKSDGFSQTLLDKIQSVEDGRVVSEIIQNAKNIKYYLQYYLDVETESVVRQRYIKESEDGFILPDGPKKVAFCEKIKAGWGKDKDKEKIKKAKKIIKIDKSISKCEGDDFKKWLNCKGKRLYNDGIEHEGHFVNGKILKGNAIYPGGAKYIGNFKNDVPHGQGTFIFADKVEYVGEWKNGKSDGQGIKTWPDGKKYVGGFKNDKINGKGSFTYPDGSSYVGEFKNNLRHGEGTLTYSDGRKYIGRFIEGLEHGAGICMDPDGKSIECTILKMDNTKASESKNRKSILVKAKKWIKISEYQTTSGKGGKIINNLQKEFDKKAIELCSTTENFNVLEKRIEILEIDETPTFGIETVVKIGIDGVVECI